MQVNWISHFTGSFIGHSPSEMLCPGEGLYQSEIGKFNLEMYCIRSPLEHDTHTHTHLGSKTRLSVSI